jgi:Ni,Fe-hydrogenase III large subunit/Ni,Fe-hydrogenase III component G
MNLSPLGLTPAPVASNLPAVRAEVTAAELVLACGAAADQGARLLALWGSDERDRGRGLRLRVLLIDAGGLTLLEHRLPDADAQYPDIARIFPAANRMQRAAFDLAGVASDADGQRRWLRHQAWESGTFPLQRDFVAPAESVPPDDDYPFVRVEGDGVHEIAVGPVHAGTIEPGHFRFQVVGEKVLRLEERLGYVHKGIEKRFESLPLAEGHRLAGRVSGDTTVGYAFAYAQAAETAAGITVPARAAWLRALALERERIANHLGDLGYLGNDGGFAFGLSQFSRLKEDVLRVNAAAFGHRMAMDYVVPGGVAADLASSHAEAILAQCAALEREVPALRAIYDEHAGLQDRFRACGFVTPSLARQLGLAGMAGRASGQAFDLRCDYPMTPYAEIGVRKCTHQDGDVAARVAVRFDELVESVRLVRILVEDLPRTDLTGEVRLPMRTVAPYRTGLGVIEGWRGPVLVALEAGPEGTIRRCHPHDVSWTNWPVLEHAVIGNIVPDFPLINKSFNLSYSGHDL